MKVGVVGTGTMGRNHVRVYSELKAVEEVSVFDLNKENAKRVKEYGAVVCDSVDEVLRQADAVSICVPTKNHLEVARRAIEKGVHCLIEKPIALTVWEGEELVGLVRRAWQERKGLVVGVGQIERFNPVVEEIRRIIKEPLFVEMRRHNPASARITDSTIVEDLMIHDVDIVFNVLFDGVYDGYEICSAGNDDLCTALIKFGSSSFASSVVSLSASRKASKKIRSVYVEEEEQTIEGDFMNQEIYVYRKPGKYGVENERYTQENIIEKVLVNKVEPLKEELKTFVRCVEEREQREQGEQGEQGEEVEEGGESGGSEFPITASQGLANLRICEEIKRGRGG